MERLTPEQAMVRLRRIVRKEFPELLDGTMVAIALAAVGCFKSKQPVVLIFVAGASAGKSAVVRWLMPYAGNEFLNARFYRSDRFTAASFVSQRSDAKKKELEGVDLLPRLKDKTLLTKELAPIFGGKKDDVVDRFTIITSVLDGDGLTTDAGTHGRRGYEEQVNFQWLGATTPLSKEVQAVMSQLGPRLMFFEINREEKDADALADYFDEHPNVAETEEKCHRACQDYLMALYGKYPLRSLPLARVTIDKERSRIIARWAKVLVRLRRILENEGTEDQGGERRKREHPERIASTLYILARASAFSRGRTAVNDYDLALVGHVALSSGIDTRSAIFRALLKAGGSADISTLVELSEFSAPTVRMVVAELAGIGLGQLTKDGNRPSSIDITDEYRLLLTAPMLGAITEEDDYSVYPGDEAPSASEGEPCANGGGIEL